MPETLTIPETLPFPGESMIEAVAQLDALASYLYNTGAGGTTDGPGDKALDAGWDLFVLGFGADAKDGPLDELVEKRSGELYDEWIAGLARPRADG